jgi:hypothetical protein
VLCNVDATWGVTLTTLFGNTAVSIKKRSLLPLLTVLFLFSYGLMTLLIVEQGSTIQSQRALIRELFSDSMQLSAMKGKAVRDRNAADVQQRLQKQAPPSRAQTNTAQAGSVQTPSSQAQDHLAPSSQGAAPQRAQSHTGKTHKPRMQMPSPPASDLADERRALVTI